jgi:nitrate/nitrite transporter NarK
MGRLADRLGRESLLLAGYVMLSGVYLLLVSPLPAGALLISVVIAFGAYYACTATSGQYRPTAQGGR